MDVAIGTGAGGPAFPASVRSSAARREHRSEHFLCQFPAGSPAETDITLIVARLEKTREAVVKLLRLGDLPSEPILVYLPDTADEEADDGGRASSGTPSLRTVYSLDAPGGGLERALVQLLLTESLGERAGGSALLVDGLLGSVGQPDQKVRLDQINATLVAGERRGGRITLADVLAGPTPRMKALYAQIATSFVAFLIDRYGLERFKHFAQQFDPSAPGSGTEKAFGKPLAAVEQEWLTALRAKHLRLMGVTGFVQRAVVYFRPYWRQESLVMLGLAIGQTWVAFNPMVYRRLIDEAIGLRNQDLFVELIAIMLGLLALRLVGTGFAQYLGARVGASVMRDLRLKVFRHLQRLSLDFYARVQVGDLVSTFSADLDAIDTALIRAHLQAVTLLLKLATSVVFLFVIEWRLALASFAITPLLYIAPKILGPRTDRSSYARRQDAARVVSTVQENVGAQPVIRAFGLLDPMFARFRREAAQLAQSSFVLVFLSGLLGTIAGVIGSGFEVSILAFGGYLVIVGDLTVGALIAYTFYLKFATDSLKYMGDTLAPLQMASGGMQRVQELLDERPRVTDAPNAVRLDGFSQRIEFDDVTFSYTGAQVTLSRVSLAIPAGESVAIVGPSGCGKSTVLMLLMRFYDVNGGSVTIDGTDVRQITQESLHEQIGTVFQEPFLFNTSIRENIRMGRLSATDEEVEAAAQAAEIHEFIMTLPNGYDTVTGDRGGQLSGGQRQRLSIARAILRNPAILVLDEATSALDPETEAAINATLKQLAKGRTLISVTHRLAAVLEFDRILVLERGQLVEQGTHSELLKLGGVYHRLWQQQEKAAAAGEALEVDFVVDRLKTIPLFKSLGEDAVASLARRFVVERYAAGDLVFEEGAPGDKLYLITRGQVEVVVAGPTGEEQRLAVLRNGDHFGEMAFYRDISRTATVRTLVPSEFLTLDRREILQNMGAVLDLPDVERSLVNWMLRQGDVGLAEIASRLGQEEHAARTLVESLIARGFLRETKVKGRYRALVGQTKAREGPNAIWQTLDAKLGT